MGRSRRRQRRTGSNGNGGDGHTSELAGPDGQLTETLAPTYVPMRDDRPPVVAPVLALEGLDPWAEILGPALALEDRTDDAADLEYDDPAQLELEPVADSQRAVAMVGDGTSESAEASRVPPSTAPRGEARDALGPPDSEPLPVAAEIEAPPLPPPPPDPLEVLYARAREAADAGRNEEATSLYRQLLVERPSHVRARNNLALLLDAGGNHQGALAELDRALDLDPENGTLLVNRGALLGAMDRYAAAERDLKKVLRGEPAHAEALFNLGVVMTKKGLWGEAVPHLQRAVELEPARAAAHYYLGEALNHVDDLPGALISYQRTAELQPNNPRALYGLGIIYDRLARPDDAARMYRRSREVGRR